MLRYGPLTPVSDLETLLVHESACEVRVCSASSRRLAVPAAAQSYFIRENTAALNVTMLGEHPD